jgi:hypothetical protein
MISVEFQSKARPGIGRIEYYWFENEHVGLQRTLFHRIQIPFEPFDSGLSYVQQPEATSLVVEWLDLRLSNPSNLGGLRLSLATHPAMEASIYLGGAHNWVEVSELSLTQAPKGYLVRCEGTVKFEDEGVARNEKIHVEARAEYVGEI